MADHTHIEWTDATWNPITGCSIVSPGCTNCYAMALAGTRLKNHESRKGLTKQVNSNHVWTGEVRFNAQWLDQPLRWTKPRMIFVCAHGDLFAEGVPDEWLDQIFAVMALCPQHTFQVLTKRPERMREYLRGERDRRVAGRVTDYPIKDKAMMQRMLRELDDAWPVIPEGDPEWPDGLRIRHWPLPNVWLGTSVEDQKRADERRHPMAELAAEGWTTWVSYEPALGPVDWRGWEFLKWLVSGGESGRDARPSHPGWHRAARDFCAAYGIPYLFKQWGEHTTAKGYPGGTPISHVFNDGFLMVKPGKRHAGRLLDGVEHNAFPQLIRTEPLQADRPSRDVPRPVRSDSVRTEE